MYLTIERVLAAVGASFREMHVASLGFGSIGRSTWELCRHLLGEPRCHRIVDPRIPGSTTSTDGCDLILAATSCGPTLNVSGLAPGTIVIDDSFPRSFSELVAWNRMCNMGDVLLVGGGMLDAGSLARSSRFEGAASVRVQFPHRWPPGCHAEALVISLHASLKATRGTVEQARAISFVDTLKALGVDAAPLHLGKEEIPADLLASVKRVRQAQTIALSAPADSFGTRSHDD